MIKKVHIIEMDIGDEWMNITYWIYLSIICQILMYIEVQFTDLLTLLVIYWWNLIKK